MLSNTQRILWEAYELAEGRATRGEKLLALEAFLDVLVASPSADWFPWARSIAEQVVDGGRDLVIRRPLFERAIFPALLAGYQSQLPGSARWLAGLSHNLRVSPACREQLRPEETTELGLLWAATKHDPSDQRSRLRLIDMIASRLRYSLHELPSGVLYGMDGASAGECDELLQELEGFCALVAQEHLEERYAELIHNARFHFRAYREYVSNRKQGGTYAEYLAQHSGTIES